MVGEIEEVLLAGQLQLDFKSLLGDPNTHGIQLASIPIRGDRRTLSH